MGAVGGTLDAAGCLPGLAEHASSPPAEEEEEKEELLTDNYSIQADGAVSKASAACFCYTPQFLALVLSVWCKP